MRVPQQRRAAAPFKSPEVAEPTSRRTRAVRALGWTSWLTLVAGGTAAAVIPTVNDTVSGLVATITVAVLFALMIARVIVAATQRRVRRTGLYSLAAGLLLWAAGSATLNAGSAGSTQFPSPSEAMFLAAYVGFAMYVLLDGELRAQASVATWLEVIVTGGGAACLAGMLLVAPFAPAFGRQGIPLLIALLYPLLDVMLLLLIAGQLTMRARPLSLTTARLVLGIALLLAADTSLVANLSTGTYGYGALLSVSWCVAFLLVVGVACQPLVLDGTGPSQRGLGGIGVVLAAGVAVVVLVFQPDGEARNWVVVPAVLTLVAAGARLLLALREARDAAEAFRLSQTDDLTGLPNRRAVMSRLREGLMRGRAMTVLLVDLDGFKEINDSLGHSAGDSLLCTMASRLQFTSPPNALVARLSADEFGLVLPDHDEQAAAEFAREVLSVLRKPVRVDGLELTVSGSIGLAGRLSEDTEPGSVMRRADVALNLAKAHRDTLSIYDPQKDEFSRQRLRVASELREGIASGQLEVWYQPQISSRTMQVCGVEALVRWNHPTDGLVPPGVFLPVARRSGLMATLSEVVVRQVIRDARMWQDNGLAFTVAVNIAPPELLSGPVLARLFHDAASAGVDPQSIIIEVTEDSFIAEPGLARAVIDGIRKHRHQVAIDDYGTGFSSLAYLSELPVNELKIDRSFVGHLLTDERNQMIVSTTNQMAKGLELRTVAEGVEDAETAQVLIDLGIDVLQGYHFAKPMQLGAITEWVTSWDAGRVRV